MMYLKSAQTVLCCYLFIMGSISKKNNGSVLALSQQKQEESTTTSTTRDHLVRRATSASLSDDDDVNDHLFAGTSTWRLVSFSQETAGGVRRTRMPSSTNNNDVDHDLLYLLRMEEIDDMNFQLQIQIEGKIVPDHFRQVHSFLRATGGNIKKSPRASFDVDKSLTIALNARLTLTEDRQIGFQAVSIDNVKVEQPSPTTATQLLLSTNDAEKKDDKNTGDDEDFNMVSFLAVSLPRLDTIILEGDQLIMECLDLGLRLVFNAD